MELIDLTMTISEKMMSNPEHPRAPLIWQCLTHEISQNYYVDLWLPEQGFPPLYDGLPDSARTPKTGHGFQNEQVLIGTHMGTHIDAAKHFNNRKGAQDAALIPLERCYGDSILLDLTQVYSHNHRITVSELEHAEAATGSSIKDGDIVILRTGHAERYVYGPDADAEKYFNCYPGLDYDASKWFIEKKVKMVGCDTINVDCDNKAAAHVNFLLREWVEKEPIQIIENLVNLERIKVPRFTFIGFPLPIVSGSGSPIRAVALIP